MQAGQTVAQQKTPGRAVYRSGEGGVELRSPSLCHHVAQRVWKHRPVPAVVGGSASGTLQHLEGCRTRRVGTEWSWRQLKHPSLPVSH